MADQLKTLSHHNVVTTLDLLHVDDALHLCTENFESCLPLDTALKIHEKPSEQIILCCLTQVVDGLQYLHSQNYVFGCLKACNVLVGPSGCCKLSGIDLRLNVKPAPATPTLYGYPHILSPELVNLQPAVPACDIWALGCLVVELMAGAPPFSDCTPAVNVLARILQGGHPHLPSTLSETGQDFTVRCFARDPADRPQARALKQHPWLKLLEHVDYHELVKKYLNTPLAADASAADPHDGIQILMPDDTEAVVAPSDEISTAAGAARKIRKLIARCGKRGQVSDHTAARMTACCDVIDAFLPFAEKLSVQQQTAQMQAERLDVESSRLARSLAEVGAVCNDTSSCNAVLSSNVARLEGYFLQGKDGPEKLATFLFGKLSVASLASTRGATIESNLHFWSETKKKWSLRWCVLRNNFIFIFHSNKPVEQPSHVILFKGSTAIEGECNASAYRFRVGNHLFAAAAEDLMKQWVSALQQAAPWFETESPTSPATAVATNSKDSSTVEPKHLQPEERWAKLARPAKNFGVPIESVSLLSESGVPLLVEVLIDFLMQTALHERGVLRVPGSRTEIDKLRRAFDSGSSRLNLSAHDPHAIAGLLKVFFRELPEPLIPVDVNQECIDIMGMLGRHAHARTRTYSCW
eukprot:TRINITY_DN3964_c0_g1_i1.p1 TRINITY_DN3964_c0_g1~~TRINITY_DN3964_c0_g1_i1.p1  ORF type:complete len:750 (-),score=147.79 TRINITY_DN3964_c0_g1_i1:387-2303(-)